MTIPNRTFAQSVTLLEKFFASKITAVDIGSYYNTAYREIVMNRDWKSRFDTTAIVTNPSYETGTITVTNGSVVITGSGTVFTSSMVGRFVRVNNSLGYYKIVTFNSATSIEIETAWEGDSEADLEYEIFQLYYAMPEGAVNFRVYLQSQESPIDQRSVDWLNLTDPGRSVVSTFPYHFVIHNMVDGLWYMEFYPRPQSSIQIRIPYEKSVEDLSGSQVPIVRADLIEQLTLYYGFSFMDTKFGDQQYDRRANSAYSRYQAILEEEGPEEQRRWGLPNEVQEVPRMRAGDEYKALHDVPYRRRW